MRGATIASTGGNKPHEFQSTLPMRGATWPGNGGRETGAISIHAPHAGSDQYAAELSVKLLSISIHAPHAGSDSQTKNTESMRDSTYNFANLIKQVLWSTQNRY